MSSDGSECKQFLCYYGTARLLNRQQYLSPLPSGPSSENSSVYIPDHAFDWVNVVRHYWETAFRNSRNLGGGTQFLGKSSPYKPDNDTIEGLYCIKKILNKKISQIFNY